MTAWELATKARIEKWPEAVAAAHEIAATISSLELTPVPITIEHGRLAGALPAIHKDPFDRMLAAQAEIEALTLITADTAFRLFGTRELW